MVSKPSNDDHRSAGKLAFAIEIRGPAGLFLNRFIYRRALSTIETKEGQLRLAGKKGRNEDATGA